MVAAPPARAVPPVAAIAALPIPEALLVTLSKPDALAPTVDRSLSPGVPDPLVPPLGESASGILPIAGSRSLLLRLATEAAITPNNGIPMIRGSHHHHLLLVSVVSASGVVSPSTESGVTN